MVADFHALLRRQLRKHFGSAEPLESMRSFVEAVNEAYFQADDERMMMERAFELSSQEILDANAELFLGNIDARFDGENRSRS